MGSVMTLAGLADPAPRRKPTADLRPGQCVCVLNPRTGQGTKFCRVERNQGGKSRSSIQIAGKCPNPVKTK
jgi:hypothetical protein